MYWLTIRNETKQLIENCHLCQKYSNTQKSEPMQTYEIPNIPFNKVGCDTFEFKNNKSLLLLDYHTKYVELEKLHQNTTSQNVIKVLKNIYARHGIPRIVVIDGGPQFTLDLLKQFENGMTERHIQTIKKMLRKVLEDHKELPMALLPIETHH